MSPQKQTEKHPGTSKGSSANVRPAAGKPVANSIKPAGAGKRAAGPPPPAPVRAVPVGSLPDEIPVGALPGGSSVSKAVVRPALGPVTTTKSVATHGKKYRRKKGTPMIIWIIIAVGGISSAGGWYYVATREPATALAAKTAKSIDKQSSENKAGDKAQSAEEAELAKGDEEPAGKKNAQRKLSVVPEAADEKQVEGELGEALDTSDAALAGTPGGTKRRRVVTKPATTASTPATSSEKAVESGETAATPAEAVTAEQLAERAAVCQGNAWKADSKDQYAQLIAVANGMLHCADEAAQLAASKLLNGTLTEVVWTTEHVKRLNHYSAKDLEKIGSDGFLVAEVTEQVDSGALLKLVSTESLIKIDMVGAELAKMRPGRILLLIGRVQPESYDLPPAADGGEMRRARVFDAMYLMGISEIYDRDGSTIGPAGGGE